MWPFKKKANKPKGRKRAYSAASVSRLTQGWVAPQTSANMEIRQGLKVMRARGRDLARNNDYAKRYLNMAKTNIVGPDGVQLQVRSKDPNGEFDEVANSVIEAGWKDFSKKKCSVCGAKTMFDLCNLAVESVKRDGEILFIKHTGWSGNKYRFALQPVEADQLDVDYNDVGRNGNRIIMGVEVNGYGAAVAYHILTKHPGEQGGSYGVERKRYPANQIIHLFNPDRVGQTRGVPELASTTTRMQMLGGYEESELVASRVGASQCGFFTSPDGEGFTGDDTEDDTGAIIADADPGTFRQLPDGVSFESFTPTHPTTAFKDFVKSILRGIASGLNVSYVGLANDLEGVSYSSIRSGEISDRDNWRMAQRWLVDHFLTDVYESWLLSSLAGDGLPYKRTKFDKFNAPVWRTRGWAWVDPAKEVSANKEAVKAGFKTVQDVHAEQGKDLQEMFEQLRREKELAELYGLNLDTLIEDAGSTEVAK